MGVLFLLIGFVGIIFGLTVVKVLSLTDIRQFERFDRVLRPAIEPSSIEAAERRAAEQRAAEDAETAQ